jgi:hypothetical protein
VIPRSISPSAHGSSSASPCSIRSSGSSPLRFRRCDAA